MASEIITVDQLKDHLGVSGNARDERWDTIARGISAFVEKKTRREWAQKARTEVYRGTDVPSLPMRHYPIVSVATLTVDGAAFVSGSDFSIDKPHGILYRLGGAPWENVEEQENISVVYTAGPPAIPDDLVLAALEMAVFVVRAGGGQTSVGVPGVNRGMIQKAMEELPTVEAALDQNTDWARPFLP